MPGNGSNDNTTNCWCQQPSSAHQQNLAQWMHSPLSCPINRQHKIRHAVVLEQSLMSSKGVFQRHLLVRSALRSFLHSWYKHKQLGSPFNAQEALQDFLRYRWDISTKVAELSSHLATSAGNQWLHLIERWELQEQRISSVEGASDRPQLRQLHRLGGTTPRVGFASLTAGPEFSWSNFTPVDDGLSRPYNPPAVTKEELGRATWTLLHTLAAQLPDKPTRQQQKDVKALIQSLTKVYPCGECADHFSELVRHEPPVLTSGTEFQRWLCRAHNHVNARLKKPQFNCDYVQSRWPRLDCGDDAAACSLSGSK